jgi:hypothetical protein
VSIDKKKNNRLHSICTCGKKSEFMVGSRDFFIGTKKIVVNKLPHFYCSYCETATVSSDTNIDELLKKTIKENQNEVNYS